MNYAHLCNCDPSDVDNSKAANDIHINVDDSKFSEDKKAIKNKSRAKVVLIKGTQKAKILVSNCKILLKPYN